MRAREPHSIAAVAAAAAVILASILLQYLPHRAGPDLRPHFKVGIAHETERARALTTGYSYYMIGKIAEDCGSTAGISIGMSPEAAVDSLRSGALDLAVLSLKDSALCDSTTLRIVADSMAVWAFSEGFREESVHFLSWLENYRKSDDYTVVRQHFLDVYDPFKKVSADFISPYDPIIKEQADSLGWDWKLLAAVIYKESKFKMEAVSPKGATGLMQVIPGPHGRMTQAELMDPVTNIRQGAELLSRISRRYRHAANQIERQKLTLAAYNAGTGRMKDCINYTRFKGKDPAYWDNIVSVIPEMRDSSIVGSVDTIKIGTFKGYETISYVESVMAIYEQYRRICR